MRRIATGVADCDSVFESSLCVAAVVGPRMETRERMIEDTVPDLEYRSRSPVASVPATGIVAMARRALGATLAVPEVGALVPLVALAIIFAVVAPVMLSPDSLSGLLRAMQFLAIVAVGQAVLMIAGELDLSVGAVAGLSSILAAWLMKESGWPFALALTGALLVGAAVGLINGIIAVVVGVPAFITTLGMLYVARGTAYLISTPLYGLPPALADFGAARPLGVSWTFLIFLAVAGIADLGLRFTIYGRMIYATGGNREVAHVTGINTTAVKLACFALSGFLASLAGLLTMSSFNIGQPEAGEGWELDVIAGVVIGGTSLFGGVGTVAGACLGLLLMQVVRSGLVMVGVSTHWQTIAVGAIMVAAVAFDLLRRRARI